MEERPQETAAQTGNADQARVCVLRVKLCGWPCKLAAVRVPCRGGPSGGVEWGGPLGEIDNDQSAGDCLYNYHDPASTRLGPKSRAVGRAFACLVTADGSVRSGLVYGTVWDGG